MVKKIKLRSLPDGAIHALRVERQEDVHRVEADEPPFMANVATSGSGSWSILLDGASYEARVERHNGEIHVQVEGESFRFGAPEDAAGLAAASVGSGRAEVKAPMPGKVMKVLLSPGASVQLGQAVLFFEAMKMQNEIRSPQGGVLVEIAVREGDAVEAHQKLFVVESSS